MASSSKPTVKELGKRLDRLVQTVQRAEGLYKRGNKWYSKCITCGVEAPIAGKNAMNGGHYIPRGCLITRWDRYNVHPQCVTGETELLDHKFRPVRQDRVKVGDMILGFDEKTLNLMVSKVEHIEPSEQPTITIELDNGKKITGTYDHRVMTDRGWATLEDIAEDASYDIITL